VRLKSHEDVVAQRRYGRFAASLSHGEIQPGERTRRTGLSSCTVFRSAPLHQTFTLSRCGRNTRLVESAAIGIDTNRAIGTGTTRRSRSRTIPPRGEHR
jgi:hypothetical protein